VILRDVMYGYGQPATGPLSRLFKTVGFYTDDVRNYDVPDRLEIANKLLDGAGLPRGANGIRFGIHLEVNSFGEQWLRQAEYLKQALAIVGIDLTLRSEDTATWLRRVYTNYDYDINEPFLSQGVDPVYGLNKQYLTAQIRKGVTFVNDSFYSNAEFDGSIVVETVFGWPGIGTLAFNALQSRDLNLLLAIFFISACLVVIINLVVDVLYFMLDPRMEI
jgi:peptide/nickel transport system substrate-binding protein